MRMQWIWSDGVRCGHKKKMPEVLGLNNHKPGELQKVPWQGLYSQLKLPFGKADIDINSSFCLFIMKGLSSTRAETDS